MQVIDEPRCLKDSPNHAIGTGHTKDAAVLGSNPFAHGNDDPHTDRVEKRGLSEVDLDLCGIRHVGVKKTCRMVAAAQMSSSPEKETSVGSLSIEIPTPNAGGCTPL